MNVIEKVRATLNAYAEGDIRNLLHQDHLRIRDLAKDMAETESTAHRKRVLRELRPFLIAHSRAEEAAVYAPLMQVRDSPDSRLSANEGTVEHGLADILLGRLAESSDASTDMWKAQAKVLHELLEHHIDDEEGKMFEELGEHFSDAEREAMGAQFVGDKQEIQSAPAKKAPRPAAPRGANGARKRAAAVTR